MWTISNVEQNEALKELIRDQTSDRVVAIVGSALVDSSLRLTFELRLREASDDMNDKLFKPTGPLGNLQPRIDLAYQLHIIEKPLRNAMYGIAEIRNLFAHRLTMTFNSPEKKMKDAIAKLTLHEGITHYPLPDTVTTVELKPVPAALLTLDPTDTERNIFFVNLKLVLAHLEIYRYQTRDKPRFS